MARMPKVVLPTATPTSEPLISICLNREWLSILHTCLTRLEWGASWKEGTDIDLAEQRTFELYERLRNISTCGGDMARLRQNPENKCQLEQSFDGGITWELAFDFSLCKDPTIRKLYISSNYTASLSIISTAETVFNTWGDTTNITEINTQITTIYGGEDSEPNLCYAVLQLVLSQIEEATIQRQEQGSAEYIIAAAGTAAIGAILFAFAPPVAAAFAVAFGGLAIAIGIGELIHYEVDEIKNADIQSIINAIYCQLKDASTAYVDMALEATAPALSGIEQVLYQRIANAFNAPPSNDKLRFWQAWLNLLGESRRIGKEGDLCDIQTYTLNINFDSIMPNTITKGTIQAAQGRDGTAALLTDFTLASTRDFSADFIVNLPANATKLKKVSFWIRRTGNLGDIRYFTMNGADNSIIASHGNISGILNTWLYREFTYNTVPVSQLRMRWSYAAVLNSSWTMWHYIDDVQIEYEV